jgi:hypothetical protein
MNSIRNRIDGTRLYEIANRLFPDVVGKVIWEDCWERPLHTGTALEWATLFAVAAEAAINGWSVSFPLLAEERGLILFPLRNEIPTHHRAQPGHLGGGAGDLANKFKQALIPKLVLQKDGSSYSVFREGCPYHKIAIGTDYDDRPDILFLKGRLKNDYPHIADDILAYAFEFDSGGMSGKLKIINSGRIPLFEKLPNEPHDIPVAGIIECSVNKSTLVATKQLKRYEQLFRSNYGPPLFLLTGNALPPLAWPACSVDLTLEDTGLLEATLRAGAAAALRSFSIIY